MEELLSTPVHSYLFALLSSRAAWLGARHSVLAQNLANADTPGFRPGDLVPFERALKTAGQTPTPELARTAAGHLAGVATPRPMNPRNGRVQSWEVAPSGNGVILEEQMEKLARTQLDHQLVSSLYGKHIAMLRTALGTPST